MGSLEQLRARHLGPNLSLAYDRPLVIVRGEGSYLFDDEDVAYLDCVNNVAHVGHQHPAVVAAATRQIAKLNTNTRYLHPGRVDYVLRLVALLPDGLDVVYLVNSGSEANDLALRLAWTHTRRRGIVVMDGGYHGNTAALIDVSHYKHAGPGGAGPPSNVAVADPVDPYRGLGEPGDVGVAADDLAAAGYEVAAFLAESFLGVAGQITLPDGYLETAYEAIRGQGGVCIADEVQVGLGRVGSHYWGFETQGVVPDIVTMGKPLGNGHPLGAVVTTREIAASFDNGMEYFNTFGGNPVSCAIGTAVLDVIDQEELQSRAAHMGALLRTRLEDLAARHRAIGDVRGAGMFQGIELVSVPESGQPDPGLAHQIVQEMRNRRVLLSTDGRFGNVIKIKPPLVFGEAEVERLGAELDSVLTQLNPVP